MQLETFFFTQKTAWSVPALPELDSERTLLLVFAAPEYRDQQKPFEMLRDRYPSSHILGCSSAGEILDSSVADGSVVVAALKFERTDLKAASAPVGTNQDSYQAGVKLAEQLISDDLKGVFLLSPGTDVNGSELVKGLHSLLPSSIPVTGGLAGDGGWFEQTWTFLNGDLNEDKVTAIGFYGNHIQIRFGTGGGWNIFGPERRVTHSAGNVLYALDDEPALALYKRYLGERADGLPTTALLFPLSIRNGAAGGGEVVRTVLAVDEQQQSMTFTGDIPDGAMARLMKANVDRLVDGAMLAAAKARPDPACGKEMLSIAISCVGRRFVMNGRTDEELEITLETMPPGTRQIGFYSYGEIAPADDSPADLHNQTMMVTTISEA
ncbi:MAG: FIST N-terminal domain-containing protein [Anaerolineales bacterium]|nr:FIST N-terminal domain-containing protein [Anaerolineales bacterium]